MKYVLGVGFGYQHYKEPANIKIFSDDIMIDDYDLNVDIEVKAQEPSKFLQDNFKGFEKDVLYMPSRCKLYTIDEKIIGKNFTFQIHCNSNNYSNGFMTKTSLVCPSFIFLVPSKILQFNYEWYKKAWQIGQRNLKKTIKKVSCATCGGRGFTGRTGNPTNDTCKDCEQSNAPPPELHWPRVWQFEKTNDKKKLHINKYEWLGGNIVLTTPVRKKYGMFMFSNYPIKNLGCNIWLTNDFLHYLDKINKFNEDK